MRIKSIQTTFISMLGIAVAISAILISVIRVNAATQTTAFSEGFEINTASWAGSGTITRTASGTNGITSAGGDFHAVVGGSHTGPNTQLGGYSSTWPSDWSSSIDIYLDPSWATGEGFIYSVAVNKPDGSHLRDFMLNAGVLNDASTGNVDKFVVLADTAGSPTSDPLYHIKAMPADRRAEITTAGWYTLEHEFQNIDGHLVTTVSLRNSANNLVKSWVLDYEWVNDVIDEDVGGNRYGWFTHAAVTGGIAIDNVTRSIQTNQYTVSEEASSPVVLSLEDGQTMTISGSVDGVVTSPVDITITGASNSVVIFIPEGTQITAEDSNWDGTLKAPEIQSIPADALSDKTVHLAVSVGSDTPLTFSQPVKLTLPGQAGKLSGYLGTEDTVHAISTECGSDPASTISDEVAECYLNDGDDLVIWTNHFSTYLAYSVTNTNGDQALAGTGINGLIVALVAVGALVLGSITMVAIRRKQNIHIS